MQISLVLKNLCTYFILFGGCFAWVLALGQMFLKERSLNNKILASYFLFLGIYQISAGLFFGGALKALPFNIFAISVPCFVLCVPLLFFYFKCIIDPDFFFGPKASLHFIFPLAAFILITPSFMSRVDLYPLMNLSQNHWGKPQGVMTAIVMYLAMVLLLGYLMNSLLFVRKVLKNARHPEKKVIGTCQKLIIGMMCIIVFWFADRIFSLGFAQAAYVFTSFALIYIYVLSNRHPEYLLIFKIEAEQEKYKNSQIIDMDKAFVIESIKKYLEDKKIYRDEGLSLKSFAKRLSITSHQLSEIINSELKKNFYTLINTYRIEEAKQLLKANPDMKIIGVAFDVGFKSQSAFYNAFQKITGTTPVKYRRK